MGKKQIGEKLGKNSVFQCKITFFQQIFITLGEIDQLKIIH
jgi:hypothetical protein